MKWLADLLDRFLDRIAPMPDFTGPDWLTDHEAAREDWLSDELSNSSARATIPGAGGTAAGSPDLRPAGDDQTLASAVVPGGFTTDEQRIQELLADYESFLRDLFRS